MEMHHLFTAILIFTITFILIISEKINRTSIALFGATMLLLTNVVTQEEAIGSIDFNTIGLLIGMMIIVNIIRRTGVFAYLAIKAAKSVSGEPWKIIVIFSVFTAIASAVLANVTIILLIVPITLVITDTLEVNPMPFVLPLVLVSNIGGTATLIGDPPNMMIGSATGFGFMDFIINLAPVIIVIFLIIIFVFRLMYKKSLTITEEKRQAIMEMDESLAIKDEALLKKSMVVLALTVIGFVVHQYIHLESASVALIGGALLMLISGVDPEDVFLEIEWPTIFFFTSLFVLVGGLVEVGVIDYLAVKMLDVTNGDIFWMVLFVLWGSAIISAFLDNIPFVATMIPLIKGVALLTTVSITPLWWALALGACLGGNGSLLGASPNLIASGILEKHGNKLSFFKFTAIGFPIMILSIVVSTVYLMLFYI